MYVNLDPETLRGINSSISNNNDTLTQSYYPQIRELLLSLNRNIQTQKLNNLLNTCINVIDETSVTLGNNVRNLTEFLNGQIVSYNDIIDGLVNNIRKSVNDMQALAEEVSASSVDRARLGTVYNWINGG